MSTITYHIVHTHAGIYPIIQSTHDTCRAAYGALCRDRDSFRCRAGNNNLLSTAHYPSTVMWSRDGGSTLEPLPEAYDYGYDDYAATATATAEAEKIIMESYIAAIERGMAETA